MEEEILTLLQEVQVLLLKVLWRLTLGETDKIVVGPGNVLFNLPTSIIELHAVNAGSDKALICGDNTTLGAPATAVVMVAATCVSSYAWDFGDSQTATTTVASTSHTYTNTGTYIVMVVASNSCGTVTKTATATCEKASVNEASLNNSLSLYPNPTSNDITIEVASGTTIRNVVVVDAIGKVVFQSDVYNASHQINVSHLSNGLYTAIIGTDKGNVMKKFEVLK